MVGNKCDKDREIPLYIAEQFAHSNNFDLFMETSALEAENVEKLFREIAEILVTRNLEMNGSSVSRNTTQASFDNTNQGSSPCSGCFSN